MSEAGHTSSRPTGTPRLSRPSSRSAFFTNSCTKTYVAQTHHDGKQRYNLVRKCNVCALIPQIRRNAREESHGENGADDSRNNLVAHEHTHRGWNEGHTHAAFHSEDIRKPGILSSLSTSCTLYKWPNAYLPKLLPRDDLCLRGHS